MKGFENRELLFKQELHTIVQQIGREPNELERDIYRAMWSEHISYKSSAKWIEELPTTGKDVEIPTFRENAGVIDLGDNRYCVVKLESHNHPTAIDPEEAAIAVGNVFRDLVAMGARPVAQLNILRFGDPANGKVKEEVNSVISSLGSYSNKYGVPVVGGEILFDASYDRNPLLNIMAIGIVKKERLTTSSLEEKGDLLVTIGKPTQGVAARDAQFASDAIDPDAPGRPRATGVADPYTGKILYDCINEINAAGLIRGMQDVGSGGILCAAVEMGFRGNRGVIFELDRIHKTDGALSPLELLLSHTQEQMLVCTRSSDRDALQEITAKWELDSAVVGIVSEDERLKVMQAGKSLVNLPVPSLVRGGGAPVYIREIKAPEKSPPSVSAEDVPMPGNLKELARTMITHPNVASRKYIYEQFDTMAGLSNLGSYFPSDAGILSIPDSERLLSLSVDGNSRYIRNDPRAGTMIAVAEAARNIVCSGGEPVAIANGLNFGDPGDPEVYWDFIESVKGIRQIAEKMQLPVVAGNVSFNNATRLKESVQSVQPTPMIGMVGIIESKDRILPISFKNKGDMIYLIGRSSNDISSSAYLSAAHLVNNSAAPAFDLEHELELQRVVSELIKRKHIVSAHDVSLGGLMIALVECCLPNDLGFDITSPAEVRTDAFLFGESQSRVVVSVPVSMETGFLDYMMATGFPFSALGHVTKQELRIDDSSFGFITDYARDFESALGEILGEQ